MRHNPVAKFAHKANKATVQRDRTKYQRKQKHKGDGRDDRHRPFCWARTEVSGKTASIRHGRGSSGRAISGLSGWLGRAAAEFRSGLSNHRSMMDGHGGRYPWIR
ncbi:MAG: hypothetical protein EHM62_01370 [Methylococcus sp.]|nr:MAG: hypothetical protein EHM62_01370 [Methylococcus sp.]